MHYPVSNSLASCGQYFCNIICLLIKFVVVVNKRFFILSFNKHPCHFHIGVPITGHFSDNFQLLNNPMPSYSYSLDHHYQSHDFGMEQKHGLIVSLITKFSHPEIIWLNIQIKPHGFPLSPSVYPLKTDTL